MMSSERFPPTDSSSSSSHTERRTRKVIIGSFIIGVLILVGIGSYAIVRYIDIVDKLQEQPGELKVEGAPATIRYDPVEEKVTSTPTPTILGDVTASPSKDFNATATKACDIFLSQFPGTPCPGTAVPGIELTATEACIQFQSQFPGTPCP